MISGDSKGVNNRHAWFGSIGSSEKGCNEHCTFMVFPLEMYGKNLIGHKYYARRLNEKILKQILRLCVIASMSY